MAREANKTSSSQAFNSASDPGSATPAMQQRGFNSPSAASNADGLARVETIARWMDARYIDPIIGFVLPGVGDVLGTAIGLYTVLLARRLGYPNVILARMILNLSLDGLFGAIPLLGSVFDLFHRANTRNLELLKHRSTARAQRSDWLFVVGALVLLALALVLPIVGLVLLLRAVL